MAKVIFTELYRFGSWGTARMKQRELMEKMPDHEIYIFKDQTNSPFTAFRNDQYVVCSRKRSGTGKSKVKKP